MKNQFILNIDSETLSTMKSLLKSDLPNISELLEKQEKFFAMKAEIDELGNDIQKSME